MKTVNTTSLKFVPMRDGNTSTEKSKKVFNDQYPLTVINGTKVVSSVKNEDDANKVIKLYK